MDSQQSRDKGSLLYRFYHYLRSKTPFVSILVGFVLPLILLILLSLFFGFLLSLVEEDAEVESNDKLLAAAAQNALTSSLIANLTVLVPLICFDQYVQSNNNTNHTAAFGELVGGENQDEFLEAALSMAFSLDSHENFSVTDDTNDVVNASDAFAYLVQCQNELFELMEEIFGGPLLPVQINSFEVVAPALTFNWVRCTPFHGSLSVKTNLTYDEAVRLVSEMDYIFICGTLR